MDQLDPIVKIIALTMGAAWASGINLYAAILVLGLLGASGNMILPPDLQVLMNPLVIAAAGFMYMVEFFTDKIPGVDTGWDTVHTFIRIPMGALLAASAVGDINPAVAIAAAIVGGGLAAGTHAAKSGARILINTSPEPFSNWIASLIEDFIVIAGLWIALNHPRVFIGLLIVFILLMVWMVPKIWRGIKALLDRLRRLFSGAAPDTSPPIETPGKQ